MIRLSDLVRGSAGGGMGRRKPMQDGTVYAGGSRDFNEGAPQMGRPGGFLGEPSQSVPGGPSMDPPNGQPWWSSMRNDILTDANGNRTRNNPGLTSWDFMRGPNGPIPQGAPQDGPVQPIGGWPQPQPVQGQIGSAQGGGQGDIMRILQQLMGRRSR